MSSYRKIFNKILTASLFISVFLSFSNDLSAQTAANGEALFKANCSSCHKPLEKFTGPALQGIRTKIPKGKWVYDWVANSSALVEANDPEAKRIRAEYQNQQMTAFHDQLKPTEIDAILNYVDAYKEPVVDTKTAGTEGGGSSDNNLLYGLLTVILAIIAFILLQVNSNLRKLTDDKEGVRRSEPVPFYRNMTYLMMGVVVLFIVGGYFLVQWGIGLGRSKGFQPEQPIYYSHQVHAGTNQISCLYCHGGAQDSKHANIPSVNVCMNCHKSISEYTGKDVLVRENGVSVNGTEEIKKLYEYAGWNPATKTYNADKNGDGEPDGAHPISWIRIHNLPDHVYFNHSQHVKVGKQQCQTCHGPITEMPEVKQFADLSMGWCINCHRNTRVDFPDSAGVGGNKFYNVYEKFHRDLKAGKMDSVTVEKIGGLECQKCHY